MHTEHLQNVDGLPLEKRQLPDCKTIGLYWGDLLLLESGSIGDRQISDARQMIRDIQRHRTQALNEKIDRAGTMGRSRAATFKLGGRRIPID